LRKAHDCNRNERRVTVLHCWRATACFQAKKRGISIIKNNAADTVQHKIKLAEEIYGTAIVPEVSNRP
jgi:hypothetical protein